MSNHLGHKQKKTHAVNIFFIFIKKSYHDIIMNKTKQETEQLWMGVLCCLDQNKKELAAWMQLE